MLKNQIVKLLSLFGLVVITFVWPSSGIAQVTVSAKIDKRNVKVGEVLTYTLTVFSEDAVTPTFEVPSFEGFFVVSRSQSSSIRFVQSKRINSIVYTYRLMAQEKGEVTIPSVVFRSQSGEIRTDSFSIQVTEADEILPERQAPHTPPAEEPFLYKESYDENGQPQFTL